MQIDVVEVPDIWFGNKGPCFWMSQAELACTIKKVTHVEIVKRGKLRWYHKPQIACMQPRRSSLDLYVIVLQELRTV